MGLRKRFVSGITLATLTFGIVATLAGSANALTSEESKFTSLTNSERSSRGIHTLVTYNDLVTVARRHSQRMADSGTIYHNSNIGNEVSGWTVLGENVGMGPTVEAIQDAFMNSPSHKANIVDRDYNQIGVGVVIRDATIYVTVVFAQRKAATTVSKTTTSRATPTTATRTTTTTRTATAPRPRTVAPRAAAAAPTAAPRTVSVLVQLVGLDAPAVNPVTGAALGL